MVEEFSEVLFSSTRACNLRLQKSSSNFFLVPMNIDGVKVVLLVQSPVI